MFPPLSAASPGSPGASRAHDVLRVLRRTGVANESADDTVERVFHEVHPSQDDLLEALAEAQRMADTDPARDRLITLVTQSLRAGRFRPA